MTAPRLLPLIVLLLFPSVIGAGGKNGLSAEDIAKIKQAHTSLRAMQMACVPCSPKTVSCCPRTPTSRVLAKKD
jgi:hypothetical protein